MTNKDIVIVAAKRTPTGSMLGSLSSISATKLGTIALEAVVSAANINKSEIDAVILGCVLSAGLGQAPARQAAIGAGIPYSTSALTVNKMCGSGLQSIMIAHDMLKLDRAKLILAGGMESMSNAPYLLTKARGGYRLGNDELIDHMYKDGLEDVYDKGKLMGTFAETCAKQYKFSRQAQDEYAKSSMERALAAIANGSFNEEITNVIIEHKKGVVVVDQDEGPNSEKLQKISKLSPSFNREGSITAANSSSISDGAAALALTTLDNAFAKDLKPIARIVDFVTHSQEPEWFTTAPIPAIQKLLHKIGWSVNDVDLFEINEAFAVVTMAAITELGLQRDKVNVNGGACALGHPIGASGAKILTTLIHALKAREKRRGIASLCIGGGEAIALAVEMV